MPHVGDTPGQLVTIPFIPEIFQWMVEESFANKELVRNFDRLWGTNLMTRGSPIDIMVDQSTGRLEHDLRLFIEFVRECIYDKLVPQIGVQFEEDSSDECGNREVRNPSA